MINLGADSNGRTGKRKPIVEQLTLRDLGVDLSKPAAAKPTYPAAEASKIANSWDLSDAQKSSKMAELGLAYEKAVAAYNTISGSTPEEKVKDAVLARLVSAHGFSKTAGREAPYVSPDAVQVVALEINGGWVFNVTGTATWGSNA
jgi:hypothetical protein